MPCPHLQTSMVTLDILEVIPGSVIGGNLMDEQQELRAWRTPGSQHPLRDQGRFADAFFHSLPGLSPQLFPPDVKVAQAQLSGVLMVLFLRDPMSPRIAALKREKKPE